MRVRFFENNGCCSHCCGGLGCHLRPGILRVDPVCMPWCCHVFRPLPTVVVRIAVSNLLWVVDSIIRSSHKPYIEIKFKLLEGYLGIYAYICKEKKSCWIITLPKPNAPKQKKRSKWYWFHALNIKSFTIIY